MKFERSPLPSIFPNAGYDENMAEIYRKDINRALMEGLEEFISLAIPYNINGKSYKVHPNINLYIDSTILCPFNCEFCIAKTTDNRRELTYINPESIEKTLKFLWRIGIDPSIQLTGGEPLLHPDFKWIVNELIKSKQKTVLNTTLVNETYSDVISQFNYVNVSAHHYRSDNDAKIMKRNRNRKIMQSIIANINSAKVRLQCNLIGGEIDTFGEIMQYIAWGYYMFDVTSFSFSWLMALPENTMYEQSIIDYVKEHPVIPFDILIDSIKHAGHWKFEKYRGGVACYYELWSYLAYEKPILVQFKISDNTILDKVDHMDDYIPDLVLHTNGHLTASWDTRLKRLL